ncbi:unnamed protein product [Closterium sp. NIES-64]|nr:unnamed protein product [Closterium sp. NIES-64]
MVDRSAHGHGSSPHVATPSPNPPTPVSHSTIQPLPLPPSLSDSSSELIPLHASAVTAARGAERGGEGWRLRESDANVATGCEGGGKYDGEEKSGGSDGKLPGGTGKGEGEAGANASQAADQVRAYRRHLEQMQENEKLLYAEIDELRAALSAEREVARATERVAEAECWRRLEVERGRASLAREVERLQEELADALEQAERAGEEDGDAREGGRAERVSEAERQAREEVAELEEQIEQVCESAAQREQQFRGLLSDMEEELSAAQAMAMVAMEREERANEALRTLRQVNDQLMQRLLQQGKVLRAARGPAEHAQRNSDGEGGNEGDGGGGVTRGEHERGKDDGAASAEGGGEKGSGTEGCGEGEAEATLDGRDEKSEDSAVREVEPEVDAGPTPCAEGLVDTPPLHLCASPPMLRGKEAAEGQGKSRASSCETSSAGSSRSGGSMTGLCSGCRQKMIRARVGAAGRSSTPSSTSSGSRASTGESSPSRRQAEQGGQASAQWRERDSDAQPRHRGVAGGEREAGSDDETASEFSFHFRGALSDSGELAGLYGPAVVGCRPRARAWGSGDRLRGGAGGSRAGARDRRKRHVIREGEGEGEESLSSVSGGGDDACTRETWRGLLGCAGRQAEEERGEGGMRARGRGERGPAWIAAELGNLVGEAERVWEWAEEKECVEQGIVQLCAGLKLLLLKLLHGAHARALPRTSKRKRSGDAEGQGGGETSDEDEELLALLGAGDAVEEDEQGEGEGEAEGEGEGEDDEGEEGERVEYERGGEGGGRRGQWLCLGERGADSRWVRVSRGEGGHAGGHVEGRGGGKDDARGGQHGGLLEGCCGSAGEDAWQGDEGREGYEGYERYETRMGGGSEGGEHGVQQGGSIAAQSGGSSGSGEHEKEGERRSEDWGESMDSDMDGERGSWCSRQGESLDGMIATDSRDRDDDDDVTSTGDSGGHGGKEGEASGGRVEGSEMDGEGAERSQAVEQTGGGTRLIPTGGSHSDGTAADAALHAPPVSGTSRNGSRSESGRDSAALEEGDDEGGACELSEHAQDGTGAEAGGSRRKQLSVLLPLPRPALHPLCVSPVGVSRSPSKLGKWVVGGVWKGVAAAGAAAGGAGAGEGQCVAAGEDVEKELEWCRASLQAVTEAVYVHMAAVLEHSTRPTLSDGCKENRGGMEGGMDAEMVEGVVERSHGQVREAEVLLGKAQRTLQRLAAVQGKGRALCRRMSSKQRVLLELQRCLVQAQGGQAEQQVGGVMVVGEKQEPHVRCNLFWRR